MPAYNPEETGEDTGRNVRILQLGFNRIKDLIYWMQNPTDFIQLPVIYDLPPDFEILAVDHNHQCRCFDLLIEHEEFTPVADGSMIPVIQIHSWEVRTLDEIAHLCREKAYERRELDEPTNSEVTNLPGG